MDDDWGTGDDWAENPDSGSVESQSASWGADEGWNDNTEWNDNVSDVESGELGRSVSQLRMHVDELEALGNGIYRACACTQGGGIVRASVAVNAVELYQRCFDPSTCADRLAVLGLSAERGFVQLQVTFDDDYVSESSVAPRKSKLRCGCIEAFPVKAHEEGLPFLLRFNILEEVDKKMLQEAWPPVKEDLSVSFVQVKQVMEMAGLGAPRNDPRKYVRCARLLLQFKGDTQRAYDELIKSTEPSASRTKRRRRSFDPKVERLIQLGASRDVAEQALQRYPNDIDAAAALALDEDFVIEVEKLLLPDESEAPTLTRQSSVINEPLFPAEVDAYLREYNPLYLLCERVRHTLTHAGSHCIVCGKRLSISSLKPTICDDENCFTKYNAFGQGLDLCSEVRDRPVVLDLLITCVRAACFNRSRLEMYFPSACVHVTRNGGDVVDFLRGEARGAKNRQQRPMDVLRLEMCLEKLPPVEAIRNAMKRRSDDDPSEKDKLKHFLREIDPLCEPLLRWLCATNRAFLRRLEAPQICQAVPSRNQFVFQMSSPEREARWLELAHRHKKVAYAWHGSSLPNWHNILRVGLKNFSNTKYMQNGAAHGAGIYFAPLSGFGISVGYSGAGGQMPVLNRRQGNNSDAAYNAATPYWTNSSFGESYALIALCQIVDDKTSWVTRNDFCYVVTDEELVICRFLFVLHGIQSNVDPCAVKKWADETFPLPAGVESTYT